MYIYTYVYIILNNIINIYLALDSTIRGQIQYHGKLHMSVNLTDTECMLKGNDNREILVICFSDNNNK